MDIKKERENREAFESLWIQSNGHFKYFVFSQEHGKYIPTGVQDNLTDQELLFASITLNTAYLFFLGGIKAQAPEGFVLVPVNLPDEVNDILWDKLEGKSVFNNDGDGFIPHEDIDLDWIYKAMIEAAEDSNQ